MKNTICVVIQTYNEEKHILECIASAKKLTDNILLVDTESTDNTVEIAKKAGVHTATFPFSRYVEPARQFGIEKAKGSWVLILDADERLTPELITEIKKTVDSTHHTYFKIPRKNIFGRKKWLQYGGWWPDHQMRLIKKEAFKKWPQRIHATPEISGSMGFLEHPIIHYFHGDIAGMVNKTIIFEEIESDLLFKAKRDVSVPIFFRKFAGELFRRLIRNKGYKDGIVGIIESIYQAFSKTITYLFLYEKKNCSSV